MEKILLENSIILKGLRNSLILLKLKNHQYPYTPTIGPHPEPDKSHLQSPTHFFFQTRLTRAYDMRLGLPGLSFLTISNHNFLWISLFFYICCIPQHSQSTRLYHFNYPLSYGVPVRERYGSTLLPATREQHDQNCTQSH